MNRLDFYNEMILRENIRKAIRLVRNKRQETLTEEEHEPRRSKRIKGQPAGPGLRTTPQTGERGNQVGRPNNLRGRWNCKLCKNVFERKEDLPRHKHK